MLKQLRQGILVLLFDGKWHNLGEIVTKVGDTIEPEKADQIYQSAMKGKRALVHKKELSDSVRLGRRRAVLKAIANMNSELESDKVTNSTRDIFKRRYRLMQETNTSRLLKIELALIKNRIPSEAKTIIDLCAILRRYMEPKKPTKKPTKSQKEKTNSNIQPPKG